MAFKILSAKNYDPRLKIRVQNTGRIGFGADVATTLCLSESVYFKFAQDEKQSNTLYIIILRKEDEEAFQVRKSGSYFYLATTLMFDSLNVDYKNQTIIYNMIRQAEFDAELGGEVYRLKQQEMKNEKTAENEEEKESPENSLPVG